VQQPAQITINQAFALLSTNRTRKVFCRKN
jgi:hypothetical protein